MPLPRSAIHLAALLCGLGTLAGCGEEPDPVPPQQPPPPAVPGPAPTPGFAVALWPGEGIPVFDAVGMPLPLRSAPYTDAPALDTLRAAAGTRLQFDSTSVRTTRHATITVLRADSIAGRDFGTITALSREAYQADAPLVTLPVVPTSELLLLQYRAEGTCFVRLDSRVLEADPCPLFDTGAFQPGGEPTTEWWVRVTGGQHGGGWVMVSDSTITLAGRRF